jgi:hypothetical protein
LGTKQSYSTENSLKKIKVDFPEAKQARSENALKNLVEAANQIVLEGDSRNFNARYLSEISGHSLGALVQRLGKVENIFLHAIAYQRSQQFKEMAHDFNQLPDDATANDFAELLARTALRRIPTVGPSILRYYENRALGRTHTLENVHAYTDECIPILQKIVERNTSNTFKEFSAFEAKYLMRSLFLYIERPFIEGDKNAGTEIHHNMTVKLISSLLSKR